MEDRSVKVTVESITRLKSGLYQVKAFSGTPPVLVQTMDGSAERELEEVKRERDAYDGVTSLFFPLQSGLCPRMGEEITVSFGSAVHEKTGPSGIKLTENPSDLYVVASATGVEAETFRKLEEEEMTQESMEATITRHREEVRKEESE